MMRTAPELVPFDRLVRLERREVVKEPAASYVEIGVRSHGKGIFHKAPRTGADIGDKDIYRVKSGDFIMQIVFAWEGAIAVAGDADDGKVGSHRFLTFRVNEDRCDADYLNWWFKTREALRQVMRISPGAAGRNRTLGIKRLGELKVPLPSVTEQKQIVAWLNGLASRVSTAKALWSERTEDYRQLTRGLLLAPDARPEPTSFSTLLTRRPLNVDVEPDGEYPFGGVYCFGRGMFRREPKRGSEFAYKQLTRVHAGEFCYPKLMAWEGAFAVVPPECDGCVVSPEFPVFKINTARILPEVLEAYFRLPETWQTLAGSSTGTNLRRRRLNPTTLLVADMPLPSMARQLQFRKITEKLRAIETELGAIESDLTALLPSALAQVFGG